MFDKSIRFRPLLTLREAFLSLLPIVLAMNILVMLYGLTQLLASFGIAVVGLDGNDISRLYYFLIPLFVNLSLSSLLAKEKKLDQIGTLLIAMVCFFRGSGFLNVSASAQIASEHGSVLSSIPLTWLAVWLLHYFSTRPQLQLVKKSRELSPRLAINLNLIVPGLLTILCFELLRSLIGLIALINPFLRVILPLHPVGPVPELILYKLFSQSAWFIGLHGDHAASGIFRFLYNTPAGEPTAIGLKTFHDTFMNMGGTGSTLVVPFLILFSKRISRFSAIARLSLPFALFNVNEILLFGLPILLNPIFLIPFFSVPFVNMAIALSAIHLGLFSVNPTAMHWMLPAFYRAYVASDGSIWALLTQLVCIAVDGCIYFPFLVAAARQYDSPAELSNLFGKERNRFVAEEIDRHKETVFLTQQSATRQEAATNQTILKQLQDGHFLLYFQPQINARTLDIVGLETLLRFRDRAGNIIPPTFLPTLYRQGLSKTIDQKVVDLVFEQLRRWQAIGIRVPAIAINFDKDFLLDPQAVKSLIHRAKEHNTHFCIEITEHTYTVEIKALASVVRQMRCAGHRISIDDFGTGYSSLTSLVSLEADEIKLDRALVTPPDNEVERGVILLASSIRLCHELGFSVVAEGIETEAQLHLVQRCAIDVAQGYYCGRPADANQTTQLLLEKGFAQSEVKRCRT